MTAVANFAYKDKNLLLFPSLQLKQNDRKLYSLLLLLGVKRRQRILENPYSAIFYPSLIFKLSIWVQRQRQSQEALRSRVAPNPDVLVSTECWIAMMGVEDSMA